MKCNANGNAIDLNLGQDRDARYDQVGKAVRWGERNKKSTEEFASESVVIIAQFPVFPILIAFTS